MGIFWVILAGLSGYGAWRFYKEHAQSKPTIQAPLNIPMPSPVLQGAPLWPSGAVPFTGVPGSVGPYDKVVRSPDPVWYSANEPLGVHATPDKASQVIGRIEPGTYVSYVPTEHAEEVTTFNGMLLVYGWQRNGSAIQGWIDPSKVKQV